MAKKTRHYALVARKYDKNELAVAIYETYENGEFADYFGVFVARLVDEFANCKIESPFGFISNISCATYPDLNKLKDKWDILKTL